MRLETHEAVALARELLAHGCGIPTPENIQLGSEGSASCISTNGMPTVASVADLLQTLLPAGTSNVPAPLRYAIARGLQAVEAPPFGSLTEFSNALARFEKGASREVLRGLLQRAARPSRALAIVPRPVAAPSAQPSAPAPQPAIVPPRSTLVVRKPEASSTEPAQPIAAAPPMFRSFGGDGDAGSPGHSARRWGLAAVAAIVTSFAMGFAVMDGMIHRRAATEPARTPGVAHEIVPPPAKARADVPVDLPTGPVEHVGEQVMVIQAVRASYANAFSPAFASDGTTIFFHTGGERDARSAIEVASAGSPIGSDLSIMTIVDDGSRNYHPQPSPDGRFVAFDSDRDGERGIYVANRDGSEVRRVSGAGYAAVPTWSRNSKWLAYIRAEAEKPSVWNVWMQPATGGNARRLTNYRNGQTWAASWFPDDRRIAYSHEDTLMVLDLQTGAATRYRTPVTRQLVRTPAVSPDGTKIIFQVFHYGAWLLDLTDGSMQCVLTDPTAQEFAWAPDGRRVAFHSRRDGRWGIYVLSRS